MRTRLYVLAAFCLIAQPVASGAQPDQNESICRSRDPHDGRTGFVVSIDDDKVVGYESYPATAASSSFIICIPIASGNVSSVGAVNIRIQVYRPPPPTADYVKFEGDSPAYRDYIGAWQRRTGQKYSTVNIQRYQDYHGCGDLTSPDKELDRFFHTRDEIGRWTNATAEQRQKFLFLYDVSPSCGLRGPLVAYVAGLAGLVAPPLSADNFNIASRHSILRKYNFRNGADATDYVALNVMRKPRKTIECLRIQASRVFEVGSSSQVIAYACVNPAKA